MELPLAAATSRVLSVTELARRVREVLEGSLREVWVAGEISNFRSPESGHYYFCLKDGRSQIAAVMFRASAQVLPFRPADGLEVIVRGRVSLYEPRGDLQLYVDWMEPKGVGAALLALEQLKRRLAAEGLFAPERKRPLPFLPRGVGIITALTGAAVRDMLAVLRARWPGMRVVIRPVRVQGKAAAREIVAALEAINQIFGVDVVIVGRGGGSMEDLWAFNEEAVARAIAASRIPVVSAVGHEIDVTIADLVADCRAPTPTAAAALVVPDRTAVLERVEADALALCRGVRRVLQRAGERVASLEARLGDPGRTLQILRQRIDEIAERMARGMVQCYRWSRQRARAAEERLEALSPLAVLERGYSIVWSSDGKVVRAAEQVEVGDALQVRLARGRLTVRVEARVSSPGGEESER